MRPIVRDRILAKHNHQCVHCGSRERLEVDHIIPLSRGGLHNESNFQILCKSCNLKKGRSVDYSKYFKLGLSPDYIEIDCSFLETFLLLDSTQAKKILEQMFYKNGDIFNTGCQS